MEPIQDFEKENALLLAGFDDLSGKIEGVVSQNRSLKKKIVGLEFEIEKLKKDLVETKKKNHDLRESLSDKQKIKSNDERIIDQNFIIRNKILRIVSDIDDKVIVHSDLKQIIELLIEEIDDCIGQLEK